METKKDYILGILLILMAGIGFSTLQLFVKLSTDITLGNKLFFRNFGLFILVLFLLLKAKIGLKVPKSEIPILAGRVVFGFLGLVFSFISLKYIILPDATTIQKLSAIFLVILSAIFLGEKFNKYQLISIVVSFFGVLLIVKPGSSGLSIGYLVSLIGTICAALAYLCIRSLGIRKKINQIHIMFYFSLFSTIVSFPFAIGNLPDFTLQNVMYLSGIIFFGILGQVGITYAYKYASPKEISIFDYIQVLDSSILSFIFLNQVPDSVSIIGYILIIGSAVYMYVYNLKYRDK